MKKIYCSLVLIVIFSTNLFAQVDSTQSLDLLKELSASGKDTMPLLPSKMLITQRLLWGKKGLMRNFNYFELTPPKRQNELKIRRIMLVSHQVAGFTTLAAMVAQGITGVSLYNGNESMRGKHESLAAIVNIGYGTTAFFSLFSPPKMLNERKGYSSIKLHKALAILHITGMIATNVLAGELEGNPKLRPYHRAAAFTAFGAFAASIIAIKF